MYIGKMPWRARFNYSMFGQLSIPGSVAAKDQPWRNALTAACHTPFPTAALLTPRGASSDDMRRP